MLINIHDIEQTEPAWLTAVATMTADELLGEIGNMLGAALDSLQDDAALCRSLWKGRYVTGLFRKLRPEAPRTRAAAVLMNRPEPVPTVETLGDIARELAWARDFAQGEAVQAQLLALAGRVGMALAEAAGRPVPVSFRKTVPVVDLPQARTDGELLDLLQRVVALRAEAGRQSAPELIIPLAVADSKGPGQDAVSNRCFACLYGILREIRTADHRFGIATPPLPADLAKVAPGFAGNVWHGDDGAALESPFSADYWPINWFPAAHVEGATDFMRLVDDWIRHVREYLKFEDEDHAETQAGVVVKLLAMIAGNINQLMLCVVDLGTTVKEQMTGLRKSVEKAGKRTGIRSLGNFCYQVDDDFAVYLTEKQDFVMQAFLKMPAMNLAELENISHVPRPQDVFQTIMDTYKSFKPHMKKPGRKDSGGYAVRIFTEQKNAP